MFVKAHKSQSGPENVAPETISIKSQKFTFDTWAEIKQLNALRECLGTGFHVHFETNDLLHEIFGVQFHQETKKQPMTAVEKALIQLYNFRF